MLARRVIEQANAARVTTTEHRVLSAVLAHTALYSRKQTRLYLGQLAATAYGVKEAEQWQMKRTREALARLKKVTNIDTRPPKGRPGGGGGPSYVISLVEIDPKPGSLPETDPESGSDSAEKVTPSQSGNGPWVSPESDPESAPPPEEYPRSIRGGGRVTSATDDDPSPLRDALEQIA